MRIAKREDIPMMADFMSAFWEWIKKNYYYDGSDEAADLLFSSSKELCEKFATEPMVQAIIFGTDENLQYGLMKYLIDQGRRLNDRT